MTGQTGRNHRDDAQPGLSTDTMHMSDFHGHYQIQSSLIISNVNGQLELLEGIRGLSYIEVTLTNCFQLHINLSYATLRIPCLVMVCSVNVFLLECGCFHFPDVRK
mgnify:CR=1 FL=1